MIVYVHVYILKASANGRTRTNLNSPTCVHRDLSLHGYVYRCVPRVQKDDIYQDVGKFANIEVVRQLRMSLHEGLSPRREQLDIC